jgi:hypothetical protein
MLIPIPFAGMVEIDDEPVAWMQTYRNEPNNIAWTRKDLEELGESADYSYIPLYARTTDSKKLTNEQIAKIADAG